MTIVAARGETAAPLAPPFPFPVKSQPTAVAGQPGTPRTAQGALVPPSNQEAPQSTSSGPKSVIASSGVKVQVPVEATAQPVSGVVLRFENADVMDIVQAILGDILHLNYLVDPSIQVRVTLQTAGSISAADVYHILESVLALHGISIVRDGKIYKVIRDVQANREVATVAAGENSPVIQIIPLRFVQASGLIGPLRSVLAPQAVLLNDPTNRHLIVVDRAQNVAKILDLVNLLDVDYLARVRIKLVLVEKADATELAREMDGLFRTSGMFNWPGTEANKIYFLPITRMNAILVAAASDVVLMAAEKWIRSLDDDPKTGLASFVHVYPVLNSNAYRVADLLRQVYGGAPSPMPVTTLSSTLASGSSGAPSAPGQAPAGQPPTGSSPLSESAKVVLRGSPGGTLAGNVQIIADEPTNSLVIRASPQDYQQIRRIIERIDTVPRQVLIQVMVAEVTLTDRLQYGVEWWLRNLKFSSGNISTKAQAGLDTGLMAPGADVNPVTTVPTDAISSGFNYLIFNSARDITGLFNLLATNTDVNILSAPHVLATDGRVAKIEVGTEEPVVTQTVSTPTATTAGGVTTSNSVQYRPTGILLEVKPSISASGRVNLTLSQEVSSRGGSVQVGGSVYPSFTKRKVATDVTIEEGKTLVVAGLIQDHGDKTSQGFPFLKDIPILGTLFGSHKRVNDKTELLITITPFIVRNREEGDRLTESFRDGLQELRKILADTSRAIPSLRSVEPPASR
ncbi:MAG: type II secretion system secretin GspD [Sulfurisoma sp.]|nr:type II secretion system secretin GspD [Sulfurisoma sp.]